MEESLNFSHWQPNQNTYCSLVMPTHAQCTVGYGRW